MRLYCSDQRGRDRDTHGEGVDITHVVAKTVEEQQLKEDRSYSDTVAKDKERKLRVVMRVYIVSNLDKITNTG